MALTPSAWAFRQMVDSSLPADRAVPLALAVDVRARAAENSAHRRLAIVRAHADQAGRALLEEISGAGQSACRQIALGNLHIVVLADRSLGIVKGSQSDVVVPDGGVFELERCGKVGLGLKDGDERISPHFDSSEQPFQLLCEHFATFSLRLDVAVVACPGPGKCPPRAVRS